MTKNNAAGYISMSQPSLQYRKGQHVVDVWMKTSSEVRHHNLKKEDTISLMVANRHSKKWAIMYSLKIEAIVDVDNNSVGEVLVTTTSDSCANIQPIKPKKNFIIGSKLEKDDVDDCDVPEGASSTYVIRLPVAIPIVAKHGINLVKISNSNCSDTMESYRTAVGMWAASIKYYTSGKNGISK
eukprot:1942938-Ditylum_brightwellii.AAC.1